MNPTLEIVVLIFAVCAAVAAITLRLRQSVIVGYLLAGALIGPHGLGLVSDPKQVEKLGEIGVIFLLFLLGTEISPARMRPLARAALGVGANVETDEHGVALRRCLDAGLMGAVERERLGREGTNPPAAGCG